MSIISETVDENEYYGDETTRVYKENHLYQVVHHSEPTGGTNQPQLALSISRWTKHGWKKMILRCWLDRELKKMSINAAFAWAEEFIQKTDEVDDD
jgi:hypothetical protein